MPRGTTLMLLDGWDDPEQDWLILASDPPALDPRNGYAKDG